MDQKTKSCEGEFLIFELMHLTQCVFSLESGDKIEHNFGGEYGTLTGKFMRKSIRNDKGKSDFFYCVNSLPTMEFVDVIYRAGRLLFD